MRRNFSFNNSNLEKSSYNRTYDSYNNVSTSYKGVSSNLSFGININYGNSVKVLLIISLVILMVSFAFSGEWNDTYINNIITERIEVVQGYYYDVEFVNYDWVYKLKLLGNIKPVFDITDIKQLADSLKANENIDLEQLFNAIKNVLTIPVQIVVNLLMNLWYFLSFLISW